MLEKILDLPARSRFGEGRAATLASPLNSTRSSNAFHHSLQSVNVTLPLGYQCNPHSKIFGSIPAGAMNFILQLRDYIKFYKPMIQ